MKLTSWEKNQKAMAEYVLTASSAMKSVLTVSNMTKEEAQEFLDKLAQRERKEKSEQI